MSTIGAFPFLCRLCLKRETSVWHKSLCVFLTQFDGEQYVVPLILSTDDFANAMQVGQELPFGLRHVEVERDSRAFETLVDGVLQLIETLASLCRNPDRIREIGRESFTMCDIVYGVQLVEHHQRRAVLDTQFGEDLENGFDLFVTVRIASVYDVQQQVGRDRFFERTPEGSDEVMGKLADEPDRVRQEDVAVIAEMDASRRGIEGREQSVLDEDVSARKCSEKG